MKKKGSKRETPFARSIEAIKPDFNADFVKFSFKYLDSEHPKFQYGESDTAYFCNFLERLKSLSRMSMDEFKAARHKALRIHTIDWNDGKVSEPSFGIASEEQIAYEPFQFTLSANEHGRVHGFIIGNRFYVVWLDREHKLYPKKD